MLRCDVYKVWKIDDYEEGCENALFRDDDELLSEVLRFVRNDKDAMVNGSCDASFDVVMQYTNCNKGVGRGRVGGGILARSNKNQFDEETHVPRQM